MDIEEYRNKIREFAIYPDAQTGNLNELMYLALGLIDEAGEVAGKIKKVYRDETHVPYEELAKELGDVAWYWARMCEAIAYWPSDVLSMNYNKLKDRQERNVLSGSGDNR